MNVNMSYRNMMLFIGYKRVNYILLSFQDKIDSAKKIKLFHV